MKWPVKGGKSLRRDCAPYEACPTKRGQDRSEDQNYEAIELIPQYKSQQRQPWWWRLITNSHKRGEMPRLCWTQCSRGSQKERKEGVAKIVVSIQRCEECKNRNQEMLRILVIAVTAARSQKQGMEKQRKNRGREAEQLHTFPHPPARVYPYCIRIRMWNFV